ncbi:MAG: PIN domain-containing protein [Candidatus Diapherotrites archaeon]
MQERIKVALDTNMLLNITKFKVDVFSEIKKLFGTVYFCVPKPVLAELEKLSKNKGKKGAEARIALSLLSKKQIKIVSLENLSADDALLKLAEHCIIATNDKKLISSIKINGGKVLFLRQRKFVCLG